MQNLGCELRVPTLVPHLRNFNYVRGKPWDPVPNPHIRANIAYGGKQKLNSAGHRQVVRDFDISSSLATENRYPDFFLCC